MSTTPNATTRIAVVTGASRGLGRSAAEHLVRAGVGVVGTYRSNRAEADSLVATATAAGVPAAALQLDVGDSAAIAAFPAALSAALADMGVERFDHLVNNAGVGIHQPYAETTEEQLDEMVQLHLKAPFLLTQALLPLINDGGRVLNVSSGLARFTGPGYAAYAAAKGAVEVLTRYQAAELGHRRIRVNVIAPGAIATDFGGGVVRDVDAVQQQVVGSTALGRVGEADDIGAAVAAILSDDLGWANGTRIEVSGGQNL